MALVVAHDVKGAKAALRNASEFTVFHAVGGEVVLGPWLADMHEVGEPNHLIFSAFHNDMPVIRPVKALLDWQGSMQAAHAATPLRQGA